MAGNTKLLETGLRASRYFWLAAAGAALCLAGVHLTQRLMILPSFIRLEREDAEKDLDRCLDAISREIYHLDKLCGDWSAWDETYQFVKDKNQAFLTANIDWPTLESDSGLNLIMFYTLKGERIWGEVYDSLAGGKIELNELGAPALGPNRHLFEFSSESGKRTGLILTSRGPLLLSSRPVMRTDGSGSASAGLIMGRFLSEQILKTLAHQTKVNFSATGLNNDPPLTREEARALEQLAGRKFVLNELSADTLLGFTVVRDLQGKPALLLRASFPRNVLKQGIVTTRLAAWAAEAALVLAVTMIMLWHILRINESRRHAARIESLVSERTAQLREAQAFLETALIQSPAGIIIASSPDSSTRLANPAALELLGDSRSTLTSGDASQHTLLWQAFHPDGSPYPCEDLPLSRAVRHGHVTQEEELMIRTRAGQEHWVSVNAAPIRDASERITAGIVVFHDITARKQAEEEIQKAHRLRSIGTLAGGIAHDFNNILMALYGNISLAREDLPSSHPASQPLGEAERSLNRAVRLTRQLLTFARGGEPIKEDVSIGQLVEEVAHFDLTGSNVSLTVESAPGLWRVEADKGQLQQVISNLTINAREAMPDGGNLHITLANEEVGANANPTLRPGRYVRLTVRDEGTGIEPKHLNRIFDPYFTTKHTGSGLGLATTYSIVNRHGGHIGVESTPGQGSTFTLHFPSVLASQRSDQHGPKEAGVAIRARRARILVLDDEEPLRQLISSMLRKSGFDVVAVADGKQAVERYKEAYLTGDRFGALIMDLTVPGGLGGKKAIREILAFDPDAKAIASSGYAEDPVIAHYADHGFKNALAKPYSTHDLVTVLDQVLAAGGDGST